MVVSSTETNVFCFVSFYFFSPVLFRFVFFCHFCFVFFKENLFYVFLFLFYIFGFSSGLLTKNETNDETKTG